MFGLLLGLGLGLRWWIVHDTVRSNAIAGYSRCAAGRQLPMHKTLQSKQLLARTARPPNCTRVTARVRARVTARVRARVSARATARTTIHAFIRARIGARVIVGCSRV